MKSKITLDLGKLEGIRRELGKEYYAKVGILQDTPHNNMKKQFSPKTGKRVADKITAGSLSNVELGIIHEFGSLSRNIPPRSFLRFPLLRKRKEIVQFLGARNIRDAIEAGNIKRVFQLIALKAETIVIQSFSTGGYGVWPALKASTIKRKGSSKPLIDTGQLRRSITSTVVKR